MLIGAVVENGQVVFPPDRLWERDVHSNASARKPSFNKYESLAKNPIIVMPELQDGSCDSAWLMRSGSVKYDYDKVSVVADPEFQIVEFSKRLIVEKAERFGLAGTDEHPVLDLNHTHSVLVDFDLESGYPSLYAMLIRIGAEEENPMVHYRAEVVKQSSLPRVVNVAGLERKVSFKKEELKTFRTVEASTIAEMVGIVSDFADFLMEEKKKDVPRFWFRGVTNDRYHLTPKIFRESEPYLSQYGDNGKRIIKELEPRMIARFTERAAPHLEAHASVGDLWSMLFVMQHYGAATRLLDWSENLLVAAHFAAGDRLDADGGGHPTVWILQPGLWNRAARQLGDDEPAEVFTTGEDELDRYAPRDHSTSGNPTLAESVAIYSRHSSPRIVSQQGVFTIAGSEVDGLDEQIKKWIASERATGDELLKIVYVGGRENMRRELDAIGSSLSIIYPGLESICKELDRLVTD